MALTTVHTTSPISVIVPAYNEARVVGACLAALARNATDLGAVEVIVVDAGCTDGRDGGGGRRRRPAVGAAAHDGGAGGRARPRGQLRPACASPLRRSGARADTLLPAGSLLARRRPRPGESARRLPLRDDTRCSRGPTRGPPASAYMEATVHLRSTWYGCRLATRRWRRRRARSTAVVAAPEARGVVRAGEAAAPRRRRRRRGRDLVDRHLPLRPAPPRQRR